MKTSYKILIVIFVITIILWLTNPSLNSFKEYTPDFTNTSRKVIYKRTFNGLIFSNYEKQVVLFDEETGKWLYQKPEKYVGFLMNFIDITAKSTEKSQEQIHNPIDTIGNTLMDTSAIYIHLPKKIKMVFPDKSIGEIDSFDLKTALTLGAKILDEPASNVPMSDTEFVRLFKQSLKK